MDDWPQSYYASDVGRTITCGLTIYATESYRGSISGGTAGYKCS
jgi:hypothetical protein